MIIGTTVQPTDAKKKKNPTARPMVSGCTLSRTTAIIVGNTGPQANPARRIVAEVAARPLTNASASISTTQATPNATSSACSLVPPRIRVRTPVAPRMDAIKRLPVKPSQKPESVSAANRFARASGTSDGVCRRTSVVAHPAVDVSSGTKKRKANPSAQKTGLERSAANPLVGAICPMGAATARTCGATGGGCISAKAPNTTGVVASIASSRSPFAYPSRRRISASTIGVTNAPNPKAKSKKFVAHTSCSRGRSAGTATRIRTLLTFTCAAHPIPNSTTATSAPR